MKEQTIAFRPDQPIFVHTPLGIIEITRVEGQPGKGYRRLKFKLPKFMTAFIGDKDNLKKTEHVKINADGLLIPTFSLLVPMIDEAGELVGVSSTPGTLRLDETVHLEPAVQTQQSESNDE